MTDLSATALVYTDGDIDTNWSENSPSLNELVERRYSRRDALRNGTAAMAATVFGGSMLAACDDGNDSSDPFPTVTAGSNGQTSSGNVITLTSTANETLASGTFTQTSGPTITLTPGASGSATFLAPSVSTPTPLGFRFTGIDSSGNASVADTTVTVNPAQLGFAAVQKSLADVVSVPAGYSVTVLYRTGDPNNAVTAAYRNDGTDAGFSGRAGDHHDGMSFFGLSATGNTPEPGNSTRGLLVMNHENINQAYLHPNGATTVNGARPTAEAVKEIENHGVSVIEVTRANGSWAYVQNSALNRRITPFTPMTVSGPVRDNPLLFTAYSPTGVAARGTINNCANGYMPWQTYATCEENWAGYFRREAGDNARRTAALGARSVTAFARYGLNTGSNDALRSGNYAWTTAAEPTPGDTLIGKFNATVRADQPANGTGDFRNEPNQYGWVVEIDPFDPASTPRKRTALGRMNHEGCWPGRTIAGVRPAFYMGDDAQNEYIYKFVSNAPWSTQDATAANRLAIGDKYLDAGTLYVARFNADGTGQWIALVFGQNGITSTATPYGFVDQADVLTHCRLAADTVGATRMDRPEWTAVNPATGEMYCTLTNNSSRTPATTDAANPRAYIDVELPQGDVVNADPPTTAQATRGNANGHIIRLKENGDTTEATAFTWDVYAFGAGSDLNAANINLSGLDASNDFSSPDGLWFGRTSNASGLVTPVLWIQTDDGAYTDVTNCMMLAAMPGRVGDGTTRTINNTLPSTTPGQVATGTATTRAGANPGAQLRRFLVGPKECEITGIDSTPDGRTVFVNIQHPGENGNPGNITSNWPASQGSANGTAPGNRPRSATIAITRNDGGVVAL